MNVRNDFYYSNTVQRVGLSWRLDHVSRATNVSSLGSRALTSRVHRARRWLTQLIRLKANNFLLTESKIWIFKGFLKNVNHKNLDKTHCSPGAYAAAIEASHWWWSLGHSWRHCCLLDTLYIDSYIFSLPDSAKFCSLLEGILPFLRAYK